MAALALALAACGGTTEKVTTPEATPAPAPRPTPDAAPAAAVPMRLFSEAELAAYETDLLARATENKNLECKRPLLRGTPVAGTADADLVAFIEPTGALADCTRDALALEQGGSKLRDIVASRSPAVVEIAKRCGPVLEEAIGKAVLHEDACSPYSPGRRVEPPDWTTPLVAANLLGLHIQLRAERGDAVGAMWLVAESIRMFQDLGRGRPFMLPPAMGAAAMSIVQEASAPIVDKLTRKQAAPFVPVFDALVASEPRYGGVLRGEAEYMGLIMGLANLKGSAWVPPGGTRPDVQKSNALAGDIGVDPRDEAGMVLGTSAALARDFAAACPLDATYRACFDALVALDASSKRPDTSLATVIATLPSNAALGDTPEMREKTRLQLKQMVLDILNSVARPNYAAYVARRAREVGRLAATRIALGVRHTGKCPTTTETIAALGEPVRLERKGKTLTVGVQTWAAKDGQPDTAIVRTLQCP